MKGIIMSGNHPQLINDGLKTMTRRTWGLNEINEHPDWCQFKGITVLGEYAFGMDLQDGTTTMKYAKCPYGQVGDRLYLKESHKLEMVLGEQGEKWVKCSYRFDVDNDGRVRWFRWADISLATQSKLVKIRTWGKWRPGRFMYRFLARIWLEITEVRAERLQEITWEDCFAEGIEHSIIMHNPIEDVFIPLWDSLNAKWRRKWNKELGYYEFHQYPWDFETAKPIPKHTEHPERYHCNPNPWVGVISFRGKGELWRQEVPTCTDLPSTRYQHIVKKMKGEVNGDNE